MGTKSGTGVTMKKTLAYCITYNGVMDIYKATQLFWHRNTTNCWMQVINNQPAEINGNICSVREVALVVVAINSTSTPPRLQEIPTYFLDLLIEWGGTWL